MRALLPILLVLLLLFPSCKPKQIEVKSAGPTNAVTQSELEQDGTAQSTDLDDNLDEFQVTPTGSSASSGSSKS